MLKAGWQRSAVFALIAAMMMAMWPAAARGQGESPIRVFVDTSELVFKQEVVVRGGTMFVPFRAMFEAMGMTVSWEEETKTVSGSKDGLQIALSTDNPTATVNGEQVALNAGAFSVNGTVLIPLRFVGEATGAIVHWDAKNREITIVTEALWTALGMTKEQLQEQLAALADNPPASGGDEAAGNGQGTGGEQSGGSSSAGQQPVKQADPAQVENKYKGSGTYKPGPEKVDLAKLQGMYYGFRDDFGGYECGGACWDTYTFMPGKQVLVGSPPHGGPETIDCKRDGCSTYKIANGKMTLADGTSYSIKKSKEGHLTINDVVLFPVDPVTAGLKLNSTFKHISYYGLIGINAASSSSTSYITFNKDGTFESTDISLGSLDLIVSSTNSAGTSETGGTYRIKGNTLDLYFGDGSVRRTLFFLHDLDEKGAIDSIQIGDDNYYIPED
ncbi:stalk domain-containing protein [Paenibacillus methanolicus]|uniref:stalk domain-containing protein n=1 Tax=Paenibacillus methanolicus TaxID=582686 RepID=UPI001FE4CA31|nr:stalk domain-containing protein [Paenibacillus methanolicus]